MVMRAREGASGSISAKTTVEPTSIELIKSTQREKKCRSVFMQRKWVVLIASVLSQGLGVACVFSLGVFYVELMDAFEVSRTQAAWVASPAIGLSQVCGMLAGGFVNIFGCGMTLAIGGIVSFLGLVASFFATSVFHLYLSFGVTVAIPAQLIDPKFYPTSFGLQITFHGVANILAPPLTAWITDSTGTYGWAMIVSGCCMLVGLALLVTVRIKLCRDEGHAKILRDGRRAKFRQISQICTTELAT